MPGKAPARDASSPPQTCLQLPRSHNATTRAPSFHSFPAADRLLLQRLASEALGYFLENQCPHGLILDRQRNHGAHQREGLCSTAATGMGLIAVALATAREYRLLSPLTARERVRTCLQTALDQLPCDHGMMPHFLDAQTLEPVALDYISTIDSAWLVAGALWASTFLGAADLQALASQLYRRIDWLYWCAEPGTPSEGLVRHGKRRNGQFLRNVWDRLNAETIFMYMLGLGADSTHALPIASWAALDPCYGCVGGLRFPSADLGLFVFQYSLELLDLQHYEMPGMIDWYAEACIATQANYQACRSAASRFETYRNLWGLSAGDGPPPQEGKDVYRCYSPRHGMDGTAHVTATLASLSTWPELVLENVHAAERESRHAIHGRYGYSNVNIDRHWISRDVVGIDLGAAVLALDNCMHHGRVRRVFHELDCIRQALEQLQAHRRPASQGDSNWRQAS
jgi:hypothetical protein